jgi:hypothetical protein
MVTAMDFRLNWSYFREVLADLLIGVPCRRCGRRRCKGHQAPPPPARSIGQVWLQHAVDQAAEQVASQLADQLAASKLQYNADKAREADLLAPWSATVEKETEKL